MDRKYSTNEDLLMFVFCLFSPSHSCTLLQLGAGTVHLESLDNAQLRRDQIEICSQMLSPFPHALLIGDFNFDSDENFAGGGPLGSTSTLSFSHPFLFLFLFLFIENTLVVRIALF
jgi:hypothetical protein